MAGKKGEEHSGNPANSQSADSSDEIILTASTVDIKQIQETENMEVHKHPHHIAHKKKSGRILP